MTSLHSDGYKFESKKRGRAVIISNANFWRETRFGYRKGALVDLKRMKKLFTRLGFSVKDYKNLTAGEIKDALQKIAEKEKTKPEADCFVCVITSHGEQTLESSSGGEIKYHEHEIAGVDGKLVKTSDLIELFEDKNCKSLKSKPKFFFIQACRSDMYIDIRDKDGWDEGVEVEGHHQKKGQGGDTLDAKGSRDDTEICDSDYDTSDAEPDSDYDDPDYKFFQQNSKTEETENDGKKSGHSLSGDVGQNLNFIQAEECRNGHTVSVMNPDVCVPKATLHENPVTTEKLTIETEVSNAKNLPNLEQQDDGDDTVDARNPLAIPTMKKLDKKEVIDIISVPCFNDMLIMFASPAGKFAMHSSSGSWMLSALYGYMKDKYFRLGESDFLSVLVEISGTIAEEMAFAPGKKADSINKKKEGSKTVPCITHMLLHDVYFDDDKLRPKGFFSCLRGSK